MRKQLPLPGKGDVGPQQNTGEVCSHKQDSKTSNDLDLREDVNNNTSSSQKHPVSSTLTGTTSNTSNMMSVSTERLVKRSKERAEKTSDSTSSSSRVNRQLSSGRSRVHGSRSASSGDIPSSQISPVSSVSSSTSATVRVSPMSVVGVANAAAPTISPRKGRKEDGWKEVGRRLVFPGKM